MSVPVFLLTLDETADALAIQSRSTVEMLIEGGYLRALQVGNNQYVPVSEISRYIDDRLNDESQVGSDEWPIAKRPGKPFVPTRRLGIAPTDKAS